MGKIVKYLHFLPIVFALLQGVALYEEFEDKVVAKEGQLGIIRNKLAKGKREIKDLDRYLADVDQAKQNIEVVATQVEALQRKLPSDLNDSEVIGTLKRIADDLNIKGENHSVETLQVVNQGFYFEHKYRFKITGTYLQILVFLEKLDSEERIYNVEEIDIKKGDRRQKGRFRVIDADILIYSYRHNPNHKENRNISVEEAKKEVKS